jgi:hypothetical protein
MTNKVKGIIVFFLLIVCTSCKGDRNVSTKDGKLSEMVFTKSKFDFGAVNQGDIVSTTFEFVNSGKNDLMITNAVGSCGCTVPNFPKNAIKPSEKGVIKVSFNSTGKSGIQHKTVMLTVNTKKGVEVIQIKANVIPRTGIAQ